MEASQTERSWNEPLSDYSNVVELLDDRAERLGDEEYCTFPDGERTYKSLAERSRQLAAGLANVGVSAGDHVAIMMYNHPAFLDVYFAVARLEAVLVPVNVSLRGDDLSYTLTNADPTAIVLGPDRIDRYSEIESRVDIDSEFALDSTAYKSLEMLYSTDGTPPDPAATQSDPLVTIYTSGTTGMPKGVVLPHGALLTVATELSERVIDPSDDDRLYMSQPLFHIFAQMVMMEALVAGIPFAMERWFSKSKFWDRVEKHDATIIHFSSAISDILYEGTEASENPVRIAFGAISDEIQEPFGEKFDCQVVPLYGLTECGGLALCGTAEEPLLGSLGAPTSYADVAIVNEQDEPVEVGEHGEIVIRPTRPNAMFVRYYEEPDQTVTALRNQWLHTGDIGYRDERGRFHFVDRKSYFLRRKGENVSVHEVEQTLTEHENIEEAVVVGVDADVGGEEILAVLRPSPEASIDPLSVIQFCEMRMAYFKIPRFIAIVDEFPRTETKGTIERHKLLEQVGEERWDLEESGYEVER